VTDAGVQTLSSLSNTLQELDLNLTSITSHSVKTLASLTRLQSLDLSATGVDHQGIARLFSSSASRDDQDAPQNKMALRTLGLRFLEDVTLDTLHLILQDQSSSLQTLDVSFSGYDQRLEAPRRLLQDYYDQDEDHPMITITGIHWTQDEEKED
jgi:hypothetical protein